MSVPYRNRTYNRVLGGPRYIHLTKGTNAVFSGFFSLLATVAISMNPITFVMNFYCNLLWHPGQSLLESNSDLSLLKFQRCQPWLNLRRRVLYPAELYGRVWYMIIARSKSNCNPLFSFFWGGRCNATLGGPRYIHLTKGTNAVFSGFSATLASAAISMNPTLSDEFLL